MNRSMGWLALALAGLCALFIRDCLILRAVEAQPALERDDRPIRNSSGDGAGEPVVSLERALYRRLCLPSGREMQHCRAHSGGCSGYARRLAEQFVISARAWEIDEWLLAAVAARESALVESALGARGERGIMQLHPRSPAGLRVRRECGARACLSIEVDAAAELLARGKDRCGSEASGLVYYNAGRCAESSAYARSVLLLRAQMRGAWM